MCMKNNHCIAFPRELRLACFLPGVCRVCSGPGIATRRSWQGWPEASTEKLSLLCPLEVWHPLPGFLLLFSPGLEEWQSRIGTPEDV